MTAVVLLSLLCDVETVLGLHDGKFCVPATTTRSGESFATIESQSQPKRLYSKLTDWAELERKRRNWRINVRIRLRSSKSTAGLELVATQSVLTEPDGDDDATLVGHV